MIALPEQGPALVRTIAETDEDATVQAAAKSSLEERVGVLMRELFSEDARVRIGAAQELIQGWRNEPSVVLALVEYATRNRENANGVYNAVVVLTEFSPGALQAHRQELLGFIEIAKTTGSRTATRATTLAQRLGEPRG